MYPYFYIEHESVNGDNSTDDLLTKYTVDTDLKFIKNDESPELSYFEIYHTNGFQREINFTIVDVKGFTVNQKMIFTVCGENFNIQDFCFREANQTEEDAAGLEELTANINNEAPTFETAPESSYSLETKW